VLPICLGTTLPSFDYAREAATTSRGDFLIRTGLVSVSFRHVGPTGTVYGIDASPEMLARAEKKLRKAGAEVVFNNGIAQALPFPDKSAGKVTIKHGPVANLDMPPMTMVFRVKDPAMLDQVKEGDKIKFNADRIDGALTVTAIQAGN
jgi:Cu/Ag efflux protein CusF